MPTLFKQLKHGKDFDPEPRGRPTSRSASRNGRSRSEVGFNRTPEVRLEVRREFLRTTSIGPQEEVYTNPESLPSLELAYNTFQLTYPKFSETWEVDDFRDREYFHLEESQFVCMDSCGFGLFSYYQQIINKANSSFSLANISANLVTHARYGAADGGTVEFNMRKRVMDYLNINDTEYSMVFTSSRGSAFKVLAESYPFHVNSKLLTVYDFESEAVNWMAECANRKGAKVLSACFKWPSLRIGTTHLEKLLQEKKKKSESVKGLFMFPIQSRMTGAKYSYQWMSEAQQNKWHVLLDASSLGPKDMDALGVSLFRPDFIVTSFYKVFGTYTSGFGCLFIKNTTIHSLQSSSQARAVGMVRIVSASNFTSDGPEVEVSEDDIEVEPTNEIQELEGDQVIEEGDSRWLTNPQLRSQGRANGIQTEDKPIEFLNLGGTAVMSPIMEVDVEDQEVEEHWESERCSESIDPANGSGDAHMVLSDSRRDGGANEIDDEAVNLETNSVNDLGQLDAEALEDAGRMKLDSTAVEESEHGSGLDLKKTLSEEIPESNLTAERHQPTFDKGSEVEDAEEIRGFSVSGEFSNNTVKQNVLSRTISETGSQISVKERLHLFQKSSSFKRHDGKPLSTFQKMGVQGLVQKFQSLQSGNAFHDEFEGTDDTNLDLVLDEGSGTVSTAYVVTGDSPLVSGASSEDGRSTACTQDVAESASKENVGFEAATSNFGTVTKPTGNTEEMRGTVVDDVRGDGIFETASHSPSAGGNPKQNIVIKASTSEEDCNFRKDGDPSFVENKPGAMSESGRMDSLREVSLVDKCERSVDLKVEHMPSRESLVHSLQHSSSFSGHGGTPFESDEENFITILPHKIVNKWSTGVSQAVIETRSSGSQEQCDKETSSALEREQREHVPTMDNSSSPESRFRTEHPGQEERLSKLDNSKYSITTTVHQAATSNRPSKEGRHTDDANFYDTNDQGLRNGRSDLRSNRTLSRNVDFVDEEYQGRPYASEMFESGRLPMVLAEDIARLDMHNSDEESLSQSEYYSGSLNGSRYLVDDLQPASYREGEEGETEDEHEDILALQEGGGDPIILCKGLDFADSVGLTKWTYRLRYLVNWLVTSLLKLRHPGPNQGIPLVRIYGPKVKYDRGAAVSFNMFDWQGLLIQPGLVQRLADRCNISLGVGRLCNIIDPEMSPDFMAEKERLLGVEETEQDGSDYSHAGKLDIGKLGGAGNSLAIPVVTAAMGFVTSFEDVYKLWSFLARFLDADYVSKEVWGYHSSNQQIVVM